VWDYRQLAQFNWIWQDSTTFLPYSVETAYLAGVLGDGDAISVQSVLKVMENLSPNAHKSFYLLAALQRQLLNDAEHASEFGGSFLLQLWDLVGFISNFFVSHLDRGAVFELPQSVHFEFCGFERQPAAQFSYRVY
jgi:hypothetical protein